MTSELKLKQEVTEKPKHIKTSNIQFHESDEGAKLPKPFIQDLSYVHCNIEKSDIISKNLQYICHKQRENRQYKNGLHKSKCNLNVFLAPDNGPRQESNSVCFWLFLLLWEERLTQPAGNGTNINYIQTHNSFFFPIRHGEN